MNPPAAAAVGTAIRAGAPATDDELMLRVQADDPEAFAELYDRHAVRALRVARAVCADSRRAEDAVQEGFLSIWRARRSYALGKGSFQAWAMVAIRSRALDHVRSEGAAKRPRPVALEARHHMAAPSPEAAAAERSDRAALVSALGQLPAPQAEVITLAFFGELTHGEIAKRLALPPGTVKGRMRLGLEKLRRQLSESGSLANRDHLPG